jgi:hypothetical protein
VRARVSGHSIMRRLASPRRPGRTFEGGCAGPLLRSRPAPRGKSRPRGRGAPTDPPRGRVRPSSHPTPVAGKFSQRPSGRLSALNPPPVQVAEGQVDVRERAVTGAPVARPKTNHLSGSRVPAQALRNGFHRRTLTETVELVSEDSPRDIAGVCRSPAFPRGDCLFERLQHIGIRERRDRGQFRMLGDELSPHGIRGRAAVECVGEHVQAASDSPRIGAFPRRGFSNRQGSGAYEMTTARAQWPKWTR